ncbi:hypothetical protein BDW72DRAFT_205685 [Aspergillus terricola var. indicus]
MYLQRPAMTGWPLSLYAVLAVTYFLLSLFIIYYPALVGPALAAISSMMPYGLPPFGPPSDLQCSRSKGYQQLILLHKMYTIYLMSHRGDNIAVLRLLFGATRQAAMENPLSQHEDAQLHALRSSQHSLPSASKALGMLLRLSAHLPHSCFFGLNVSKTASVADPCNTPP